MYKCAKCNDYLDGHTCRDCMLRHKCMDKKCACQQYPLLPPAVPSFKRFGGQKSTWRPWGDQNRNAKVGGRPLSVKVDGF